MVIAKTASRNVAFKAAKMSEALLETQSSFISRSVVDNETSSDFRLRVLGRVETKSKKKGKFALVTSISITSLVFW